MSQNIGPISLPRTWRTFSWSFLLFTSSKPKLFDDSISSSSCVKSLLQILRYLEHKSHRIPLILHKRSLLAGVRRNLGNPSRDEKVQKHCFPVTLPLLLLCNQSSLFAEGRGEEVESYQSNADIKIGSIN